jgi:hypothetical protein
LFRSLGRASVHLVLAVLVCITERGSNQPCVIMKQLNICPLIRELEVFEEEHVKPF